MVSTDFLNVDDFKNDINILKDSLQPIAVNYQDGKIFVYPANNSSNIKWADYKFTGATSLTNGEENTNKIVSQLGEGDYAAKLCYDLVAYGYDDWYLPSYHELIAIYKQTSTIKGINYSIFYWSSSESSKKKAWLHYFY